MQGAGFRVQGSGFRVQSSGFRDLGSGFRVLRSGFSVHDSGFRVQGSGFGVEQRFETPKPKSGSPRADRQPGTQMKPWSSVGQQVNVLGIQPRVG